MASPQRKVCLGVAISLRAICQRGVAGGVHAPSWRPRVAGWCFLSDKVRVVVFVLVSVWALT